MCLLRPFCSLLTFLASHADDLWSLQMTEHGVLATWWRTGSSSQTIRLLLRRGTQLGSDHGQRQGQGQGEARVAPALLWFDAQAPQTHQSAVVPVEHDRQRDEQVVTGAHLEARLGLLPLRVLGAVFHGKWRPEATAFLPREVLAKDKCPFSLSLVAVGVNATSPSHPAHGMDLSLDTKDARALALALADGLLRDRTDQAGPCSTLSDDTETGCVCRFDCPGLCRGRCPQCFC